jgi:hypothetical protein
MTIKTSDANIQPSAPPESDIEEGIVVYGQAVNDADAIPFATAIPLDENVDPSAYSPSYGGTQSSAPLGEATLSGSPHPTQANHLTNAPPAVPEISTVAVATPPSRPPPPGVAVGGRWVLVHGVGPNTWSFCAIFSAISCICLCLPCGLWALLCPCDQHPAYLLNGKLFDEDGGMIGSAKSRRYR